MNPFPGMNPFLEDPAYWADFHARFITYLCDAIAERLPDAYESRIDESVRLVQMAPEKAKMIYPDVAVSRDSEARTAKFAASRTAVLEPQVLPQEIIDEIRETRVEILHRPERELVTVIEVLSPANKLSDYAQYLAKRRTILRERVNLLELDLLLQGQRVPLLMPLPASDYYAFLTRASAKSACEVYAFSMKQPLPTLPVPLRAPDPDVTTDIQAVFEEAFQRGRYARSLDYARELHWATAEQRRWVAEQLAASTR